MGENKLDEKVITVSGKDIILTRAQRHILYSLDEQKPISGKYSDDDVLSAMRSLTSLGLLSGETGVTSLTWEGVLCVNAMRLVSDAPSQSSKAIPAVPCEICGHPTEDTLIGTGGNRHAVCYECGVRVREYKICKVIGHDLKEVERFPYPGKSRVSPGILVMNHCVRCNHYFPELDSIYD